MAKRHQDALAIIDPGACNPSGIAHAIIEACREARDAKCDVRTDSAIKLMTYQLAFLMGMEPLGWSDYHECINACERFATEAPAS